MLRRQSLQSQITTFIMDYIEQQGLQDGDRLPPQAQLAKMMDVSILSLREAVKTLEAKDILKVINGKGIYVKSFNPNIYSAQIELKREKDSLLDLLRLRRLLEHEILAMLIQRATEAELDEIGDVVEVLMRKYHAGVDQTAEDRKFHKLIYRHCHSDIMTNIINFLDALLDKFQDYPLGLDDPFTETIPLHEAMYLAIRARDTRKTQKINDQILDLMTLDLDQA